jgi:hypothetical protein
MRTLNEYFFRPCRISRPLRCYRAYLAFRAHFPPIVRRRTACSAAGRSLHLRPLIGSMLSPVTHKTAWAGTATGISHRQRQTDAAQQPPFPAGTSLACENSKCGVRRAAGTRTEFAPAPRWTARITNLPQEGRIHAER